MDYSLLTTGYAGIGISTSTDGGATWTKDPTPIQLPVIGSASFNQGAAAPTVAFDAQGNVYVSFMAATFLGPQPNLTYPDNTQRLDGFESNNGIFVAKSTNGGTTWNTPQVVVDNVYHGSASVQFSSDPSMAIDNFTTLANGQPNPNYGNLYVTWAQWYPPGQFPGDPKSTFGSFILFASSNTSNGGSVWTTQMQTVPGPGAGTGLVSALRIKSPETTTVGRRRHGIIAYSTVTVGAGGAVFVSTFTGGYFPFTPRPPAGRVPTSARLLPHLGQWFHGAQLPDGPGHALRLHQQIVHSSPTLDNFRTLPTREIAADPTRPGVLYAVAENTITEAENSGASPRPASCSLCPTTTANPGPPISRSVPSRRLWPN